MSGMSSMLCIRSTGKRPLATSRMKERNSRSGRSYPQELFPFHSARCARSRRWHGGIPSMLLMPLMRMTPGFWMPEWRKQPSPQRTLSLPGRRRSLAALGMTNELGMTNGLRVE